MTGAIVSRLPPTTGKTPAAALLDIPERAFDGRLDPAGPARYRFDAGGFRFDLLWRPRPGAGRLFLLFSGAVDRARMDPPVFQRWSWAPHFPGHCLFVADPMLHLDPALALAWDAGTPALDPLAVVAALLERALPVLGLAPADVVAWGSSGGGFAALRMASVLPGAAAVAVNPQTVVTAYAVRGRVRRFLDVCFGGLGPAAALAAHPDRLSLMAHLPALARARIVLAQNTEDAEHLDGHMRPFCAALGVDPGDPAGRGAFRPLLFTREGGHMRAEPPEVFARALELIGAGPG